MQRPRSRSRLVRIIAGALAVLALVYLLLWAVARPRPQHPYFQGLSVPIVLAHQGGDRLWPSNTLLAFERSLALGAQVLEVDVHSSRDGVLVVIHDDTVDRTTNGTGRVSDLTFAEIRQLDAGYDWSPERQGQSFPYRGSGLTIPSLAEVFEAFPGTKVNVEIKQTEPSIVEPLCRSIRDHDRGETVMVSSFHDSALRDFRRACPEVATSAGPAEVRLLYVLTRLNLGNLYRPAAEALQVPEFQGSLEVVTPALLRNARAKNVQVHAWTPNEVDEIERLLAKGVDGIITDRPDRALRLLGREVVFDPPSGVPR